MSKDKVNRRKPIKPMKKEDSKNLSNNKKMKELDPKNSILSILNDKNDDEIKVLVIELLEEMYEYSSNKYENMSWDDIIEEYYEDKFLFRRFKLIHNIISQKRVCENSTCEIFPDLTDIAKEIDDLEFKTKEDILRCCKVSSPKYNRLLSKINLLNNKLTKVFEKVFSLYASKSYKLKEKDLAHKRIMERITAKAKYKLPLESDLYDSESDSMSKNDFSILTPEKMGELTRNDEKK